MLIYCIDDDPDWQNYYQNLLSKNHTLRHFPDGISAISAIDEDPPDAILLDMLLAGPSAVSLLAELQSYPDLATIPVALVTGVDIQSDLSPYGVQKLWNKATMNPKDLKEWISKQTP